MKLDREKLQEGLKVEEVAKMANLLMECIPPADVWGFSQKFGIDIRGTRNFCEADKALKDYQEKFFALLNSVCSIYGAFYKKEA